MLRDFFAALYNDWLTLVSGIASVVLAVWVVLFTPTNEVSRKALWITFALCLFVAAYRLWAREHKALERARIYPDIRGRIDEDSLFIGVTRSYLNVTYIPIVVTLVNHNLTETAIDRYELTVLADGKEYEATNISITGEQWVRPAFDKFGLPTNPEGVKTKYKDLYANRHEVLKRGIPQHGWLNFVLTKTLIQTNTDCRLRLTVVDAFGGRHILPEVRPMSRKSGSVSIPIEIDINDPRPVTSSQLPDDFNERLTDFMIEGASLLGECNALTNVTLSDQFKTKVGLWVLDVESFLKERRGKNWVNLFHLDTGPHVPLRGLLYSRRAILSHYLRSRLKNLKAFSL